MDNVKINEGKDIVCLVHLKPGNIPGVQPVDGSCYFFIEKPNKI